MLSPLENHKSTKYSSYEGLNAGKKGISSVSTQAIVQTLWRVNLTKPALMSDSRHDHK